jgi:hypothetical protein
VNLASLDHSQDAIDAFEASLVQHFNINPQEAAAIHAAGQTLHTTLVQIRQSAHATVNGKASLAAADFANLNSLAAQREQLIVTLSNQILNSVQPATAARLTAAGNALANRSAAAKGGN